MTKKLLIVLIIVLVLNILILPKEKLEKATTNFFYAVEKGNIEQVKTLLTGNPNLVNAKYILNGATPLHNAAFNNNKEMVELLLANGADVNAKDNGGQTPLFYSIYIGKKTTAELLLAHGADVNAKDVGGMTPLHWATSHGHNEVVNEVVEVLLAHGADVNAKNTWGRMPLYLAAINGNKEIVEMLLVAHRVDINAKDNNGNTPLDLAITTRGNKDVVEVLLAHGADVNAKDKGGWTPLDLAMFAQHDDVAEILRSHGGKVGAGEIFNAIKIGDVEKVKTLLAGNPDLVNAKDKEDKTPLDWAMFTHHDNIIAIIQTHGGKVGAWEIFNAIKTSDIAKVKILLTGNPDLVNAKDKHGKTPLDWAADVGNKEIVEVLLAHGADVNSKANNGWTPLDVAISHHHDDIAEILRAHGGKSGKDVK